MEGHILPALRAWQLSVISSADRTLVMKISGCVKTQDAWAFSRELQRKGVRLRHRDLVLDLSDLEYASVEVLQYLAAHYRPKARRPLQVTLINTPYHTEEKLRRLGPLPYLRYSRSIRETLLGLAP